MRKKLFNRVYVRILSCKGKKITRYTFAAMLVASLVSCSSCQSESQLETPQEVTYDSLLRPVDCSDAMKNVELGVFSDTNRIQLATCEKLLDECVEAGILDKRGVKAYRKIAKHPSVSRYMELIDECVNENTFYDTVGEGDAWCDYCDYVLSPRGELCGD